MPRGSARALEDWSAARRGRMREMKPATVTTAPDIASRRAAARRTAVWLGAAALAVFVAFLFLAVRR